MSTEDTPAAVPDGPRKCRAVKHGRVDLHCTEPEGHDRPKEGDPTWHMAVYTDHHEVTYDGARHVVHLVETVTWEPVDHAAEAARHLMAAVQRDS